MCLGSVCVGVGGGGGGGLSFAMQSRCVCVCGGGGQRGGRSASVRVKSVFITQAHTTLHRVLLGQFFCKPDWWFYVSMGNRAGWGNK